MGEKVTVKLENVQKSLKDNQVLNNITYTFEGGKIYGVYGHNGCGKTMLLRAISGLLIPDDGKVMINEKQLHKDNISFPESIGIIIEHMELLPQYSAYDNLKILAKIKNKAKDEDIKEALEAVGLESSSKKKVRKFSLGMKQRLNIAQAVFENPEIIILDEPTNAIDTKGIELIYILLRKHRERGALIIITSHHKDDLQELSDITLKMEKGMIVDGEE